MFRRKTNRVHFEESMIEPSDAEFNIEFSKYNQCSFYMALVFLLTCAVQFCIELDRMVLLATDDDEVSCTTKEHQIQNFSTRQMVELTYPDLRSACMYYKFDKELFNNKTFYEAHAIAMKVRDEHRVVYTLCSLPLDFDNFTWDQKFMGSCKSFRFRHRLHIMLNVGSSLGYIFIGVIADLWGRKTGFYVSLVFWLVGILTLPLTRSFINSMLVNIIKGFGKGGLSLTSIVLFLEICNKHYRGILTIYVTSFGPIAELVGILLKHNLQVSIGLKYNLALPSILLLFYAFYMPESPKWFLSYGQKVKAWQELERLGTDISKLAFLRPLKFKSVKIYRENFANLFITIKYRKCLLLCTFLLTFILKIGNAKKLYVTLKSLKLSSHRHLIILAEIASFMYVLPPFIILGRHLALCWFVTLTLVQLVLSLFANYEWIYIFNILTVLAVHALVMVMKLYVAEIFPTCTRCTSAGFIFGLATVFYLSHSLVEEIEDSNPAIENILFICYAIFGLILLGALPYTGAYELPDHKRYRNEIEQQSTD